MKASFPNLGYDTYALKTLLEDLGAEVVLAPPNSRRTIELGSLHSPELICMPYKITLGNMIAFLYACENEGLTILDLSQVSGFYLATASRTIRAFSEPDADGG